MSATHCFKDKHGQLVTPVKVVTSYGWPDLISLGHYTFTKGVKPLIPELAQSLGFDENSGKTWGAVLYTNACLVVSKMETALGKKINKFSRDDLKSFHQSLLTIDRMKQDRPKHYCTNEQQQVIWAEGVHLHIVRDYPFICSPVNPEQPDLKIHDTAKSAAEAWWHDHEDKVSLVTGFSQVYQPIFGGNPMYLEQHSFLDKALGPLHPYFERAYAAFEQWRKEAYINGIRKTLLARDDIKQHGWIDLKDFDGNVVATVPYLPLLCWALDRSGKKDCMPDYTPTSPSGLRLNYDSAYHSDWMLAAGLDLKNDSRSNSDIQSAALDWQGRFQSEAFGFEHTVLSAGDVVTGPIQFATPDNAAEIQSGDIVVIPHAGPQYQLHVERACRNGGGGVIAIQGNKAAHLSVVGRERGMTIFMIEDAARRFPKGTTITLDPSKGAVTIG